MRLAAFLLLASLCHADTVVQGQYTQLGCGFYAATTIAANVATGSQTVTPAAMHDSRNNDLEAGMWVTVANSDGSHAETIQISAIAATTFTATFGTTKTGPGITVTPGCNVRYYPSAGNLPTDPIALYICGGGFADCNDGVTTAGGLRHGVFGSTAYIMYQLTQMGYHVYAPRYTTFNDPGYTTTVSPRDYQNLKCFVSKLADHTANVWFGGNVNNMVAIGDSAGASQALMLNMSANSAWLSDGNGACETTPNLNWTVRGMVGNSMIGDFTASTNGWGTTCGSQCSVESHVVGSYPVAGDSVAIATAASGINMVASWQAKGSPPITLLTATADNLIAPAAQHTIVTAVVAAGGKVNEVVFTGFGHGIDQVTTNNSTYPPDVTNWVANQTGANCTFSPCQTLSKAWQRTLAAIVPFGSGGGGGSNATKGDQQ